MWAHWDPLAVCVCVCVCGGGDRGGEGVVCVRREYVGRETHLTKFITGRALHTQT